MSVCAAGISAEITSQALAAILSIAAAAPEDLEGLLFGRTWGVCSVVESFLLTGGSWTLCDTSGKEISKQAHELKEKKEKAGQRLLGWCSIRANFTVPAVVDRIPTHRERQIHMVMSAATSNVTTIGSVFLRNTEINENGAFALDTVCYAGPYLAPLELRVRSMGTTSGKENGAPPLPVLGPFQEVFDGLEPTFNAAVGALEGAIERGLAETRKSAESLHTPGVELHHEQRTAWKLKLEDEQRKKSLLSQVPSAKRKLPIDECPILPPEALVATSSRVQAPVQTVRSSGRSDGPA